MSCAWILVPARKCRGGWAGQEGSGHEGMGRRVSGRAGKCPGKPRLLWGLRLQQCKTMCLLAKQRIAYAEAQSDGETVPGPWQQRRS